MSRKIMLGFSIFMLIISVLSGASDYRIGPKDIIKITVFKLDELNTEVRVSESGFVALPLLGKIKVEGLTPIQLEELLREKLEERFLQDPQVTVFIKEYMHSRVFVLGAVRKPGAYSLLGKNSLLQIIAQAEGLSEFVAGNRIVVIRGEKKIHIEISDLLDDFKPEANLDLEADDLIIVPQERTRYIYVIGEVKMPGLTGIKKSGGITLLEAIARAGGFTDKASRSNVILHRKIEGKIKIFKFDVKDILFGKDKDFEVKEGDIIYVKESIF